MTTSIFPSSGAGRVFRVAIICAILIALGAMAFYFAWYALGVALVILAIALGAAFYLLAIRPARIPRDAVLIVRLSGSLSEEPQRSFIDQLRGRGFPALSHLRAALQAVRDDPPIRPF